jgi:hypothetical protein
MTGRRHFLLLQIAVRLVAMLIFLCALVVPLRSLALSAELPTDVNLDVNDTVLRVTGRAMPNALVSIFRDDVLIGTATTDASGVFDKSFTSQSPGIHTIKLFAKTSDNKTTDTVAENVNLVPQSETVLTVFLPTVIELSSTQVTVGSDIVFSGVTIPSGEVTIWIDNNLTFMVIADSEGKWSHTVSTEGFYIGTHFAHAVVHDEFGEQSAPTSKRAFQVQEAAASPGPDDQAPVPGGYIAPPIITSPQNNQHFSRTPIEVQGIAQPNSQIEIWEDGQVIGSVFANHEGEWLFMMHLYKPQHTITVRACIGTVCSNFSDPLTIFYDRPGVGDFFFRLGNYRYTNIGVNQPITLELFLENGQPPYRVVIDWGNDKIETLNLQEHKHKVTFAYASAGQYTGIATAKDSNNQTQTRYFSVRVVERQSIAIWIVLLILVILLCLLLVVRRQLQNQRAKAQSKNGKNEKPGHKNT